MKRREFLKYTGFLAVGSQLSLHKAMALTGLPIDTLKASLAGSDLLLVPSSPKFSDYNVAFNKRTQLTPQVRVVASSSQAVQSAVVWAQKNGVEFAVRSGGHSYEGFSQSRGLVIDTRGLETLDLSADKKSVTIGAGHGLGEVYKKLAPSGLAIPAGSCFPVGVSGHTLGGGFGFLGRPFGLACDNVESIEMVDSWGQLRTCSDQENQDLFWALRGGGNGNFGIVTKFQFRTNEVSRVVAFGLTWNAPIDQAVGIVDSWQHWLPTMSSQITGSLHLEKAGSAEMRVHFAGLSVGTQSNLIAQLKTLQTASGHPSSLTTTPMDFLASAERFNGKDTGYESIYMKAKSDYVNQLLSTQGIRAFLTEIHNAPVAIAVMFDTYGGEINKIPRDATAFVHRGTTMFSIQYYTEWGTSDATDFHVQGMRKLYDALRPYVSGECYVNYCDLDLGANYAKAYWAENLPRLQKIKQQMDPQNLFKHAQSVPIV